MADTFDDITEERIRSIEETVHVISLDGVKALGETLFPAVDHPWREKLFAFLDENPGATFHHAVTHDRIHIIYCDARQKGMWFMPGSGVGPLQPKGIGILHRIIAGS